MDSRKQRNRERACSLMKIQKEMQKLVDISNDKDFAVTLNLSSPNAYHKCDRTYSVTFRKQILLEPSNELQKVGKLLKRRHEDDLSFRPIKTMFFKLVVNIQDPNAIVNFSDTHVFDKKMKMSMKPSTATVGIFCPPGLTPEIFAPGIVSVNGRYEYAVSFSSDLDEM